MTIEEFLLEKDEPKKDFSRAFARLSAKVETEKALTVESWFRCSSIAKICPRGEALRVLHGLEREKKIPWKLAKTYLFGKAFEKAFRDDILFNLDMLRGKWRCKKCGQVYFEISDLGWGLKPKGCDNCGSIDFQYEEIFLQDKDYYVGGSIDAIIYYDNSYYVLEMKTISSYNWEELKDGPLYNHLVQINMYLYMMNIKRGKIWYFNKDTSQDKVFDIVRDDYLVWSYLLDGLSMRIFFEKGILPERKCLNSFCPRARECQERELCWIE